jgi:hypothetical protein
MPPYKGEQLVPVGLELMTETVELSDYLGGLACVGNVNSGSIDDTIATLASLDPQLGAHMTIEVDAEDILSLA